MEVQVSGSFSNGRLDPVEQVQAAEQSVSLDRAGITVFRDITFLAAGPASEGCRSAASREDRKSTRLNSSH